MSRQSTDEQLRFLLSCVRHSQNGKVREGSPDLASHPLVTNQCQVDFIEVAKECGIVTKGAA
jgi:hypothetical protein